MRRRLYTFTSWHLASPLQLNRIYSISNVCFLYNYTTSGPIIPLNEMWLLTVANRLSTFHRPPYTLKNSTPLIQIPVNGNKTLYSSFRYRAVSCWNNLPKSVRLVECFASFKRLLSTVNYVPFMYGSCYTDNICDIFLNWKPHSPAPFNVSTFYFVFYNLFVCLTFHYIILSKCFYCRLSVFLSQSVPLQSYCMLSLYQISICIHCENIRNK